MTNQLKGALLASVTSLALTGSAAAASMNMICAQLQGLVPCAYDPGGDALGVFQTEGILNRLIGGTWHSAGYDADGLTVDLTLYYASQNCTGPALIASGYIGQDNTTPVAATPPTWIQWDGANFWSGAGPTAVVNAQSQVCQGATCNGNPQGACLPYTTYFSWGYPTFSPATIIGTPTFKPAPRAAGSCGKATGVSCVTVR